MPVTKTAKRALRSSKRKETINKIIEAKLEKAIRIAKKARDKKSINNAFSLIDRAVKKKLIHKNKASRIKSSLSMLISEKKPSKSKEQKSPTSNK